MKGYTRDGRVTKNHPMIAFVSAMQNCMQLGEKFFVSRTIDNCVRSFELIDIHASFNRYLFDSDVIANIWYNDGEKEVFEKATELDLMLFSNQAKQKQGVKTCTK